MHRSGTSALSGLLGNLGCDVPATLMAQTERNPKGYFESEEIYHFHEDLFRHAGSSWDDFRPFPQTWLKSPKATEYIERAQSLIDKEFGSSRLFVMKDPRICRLMPFWLEVLENLDITPVAIHIHRNPLEVSQSLKDRDQIDTAYGTLLWLNHVLEAEKDSRPLTRSFIGFEKLLSNWAGEAKRLGDELGISWPRFSAGNIRELEGFLDPSLKHYSTNASAVIDNTLLPAAVREVYAIMQRWSEFGDATTDFKRLDEIRHNLLQATDTLGAVVQSRSISIQTDRENLRKKLTEATDSLGEKDSHLQSAIRERDEIRSRVETLNSELEQARQDAESAARTRDGTASELAEINAKLNDQVATNDKLEKDRASYESQIHKLNSALNEKDSHFQSTVRERDEIRSRVETLNSELEQARQDAESAARTRDRTASELAEINATLNEQVATNDKLEKERSSHESRIHELNSALSQRSAEIDDIRAELEAEARTAKEKAQMLATMESRLLEANLAQARHRSETERRDAELAHLGELLLRYTNELDAARNREQAQNDRLQELQDKHAEVLERLAKVTDAEISLPRLEQEHAALQQHVHSVQCELDALRKQSAHREQKLRQDCEQRDMELSKLTKSMIGYQKHEEELSEARDLLAKARAETRQAKIEQERIMRASLIDREALQQLQDSHQNTAEKLQESESRNSALLRSTSWRITAPMRWLSLRIRRRYRNE
jgi:hypothetical protein